MRHLAPRALSIAGALLLLNACGGPAPVALPPASPAPPVAQEVSPPPPLPAAPITAGALPGDTQIYAEITGVRSILAATKGTLGSAPIAEALATIAREVGVEAALAERVLSAVESIHAGGRRAGNKLTAAVSIVFSDAQPIRDVIAAGALVDRGAFGAQGRRLQVRADKGKATVVWFDGPRLLVAGEEPMVEAVAAVATGSAPGLGDLGSRVSVPPQAEARHALAFVAPALLDELTAAQGLSFAAPLSMLYDLGEGGLRGAYRTSLIWRGAGADVPYPAPRALALARVLPADTLGYVALSTRIPGGRAGALKLLAQVAASDGEAANDLADIDTVMARRGLSLAELAGALGDEAVAGVTVRPGVKSEKDLESNTAVTVVADVADAKLMGRVLALARDDLGKVQGKGKVHAEGDGFTVDLGGKSFARTRLGRGRIFVGFGPRDLVERAFLAVDKGKGTLADVPAHARAVAGLPADAQLRTWLDLARVVDLAAATSPPGENGLMGALRTLAGGPATPASSLSFSVVPDGDRMRLALDEVNTLGTFAALGVYGVRRYLTTSKSAEAKNLVGAIARSAAAAYEREDPGPGNTVVHRLCKSAQPVPSAVPAAKKYQSSTQPGTDWATGDAQTGWRCLKFTVTSPQYYRYTYSAGGPYKGPARGGPDPGPGGFEVAAEGDLDGNGVTSLFTITGTVDPRTHEVRLSNTFVSNELE